MAMKRIYWIIIAAVAVFLLVPGCNSYNSMVEMEENVSKTWADVETQYQRRSDLIPNLVATVKGYADFEQKTLTDVIEARSKASSINIDPSNLNAQSLQQFQSAQGELSSALSRLMVVVERYPDLKANEQFMSLQAELAGTENRITIARNKFNKVAQEYNTSIKKFPKRFYASLFGFDEAAYFKSEIGADKAPEVSFE
ncbi:MAG TPA: LemA family protein [Flavobacteriales bacterium]|nr:LemA family protein [Flavobacteriales bacterium]